MSAPEKISVHPGREANGMPYVRLGNSGLEVSRICLGMMSYGITSGSIFGWSVGEEEARQHVKKALESGINFFDTANIYSAGSSEEITGRALRDFAVREEIVVATKCYFPLKLGQGIAPNTHGLSRKHIFDACNDSLKRLGMDYIDLYQIHRWDYNTPIEETMEALHDLVKSGKVRYIGASSMFAWQFAKAQHIAEMRGWTKFITMQNHYNLVYREEEREMMPLCNDIKVSCLPYSPLAKGFLCGKRSLPDAKNDSLTAREKVDAVSASFYFAEADYKVVEQVTAVAKNKGVTNAQVALAWILSKNVVGAPIVGCTKMYQLEEAIIAATQVKLTEVEVQQLESSYIPHEAKISILGKDGKQGFLKS